MRESRSAYAGRIVAPRIAAALALAALALAGCGGENRIDHPADPDEPVLRVELSGGLVPPEVVFSELPRLSLYGDGTLVVPAAQPAIYPGPALPGLVARTVAEEGVQAILREADAAGLLGPDRFYELEGIADAATTTFTTVARGSTHVVSAYALGLEGPLEAAEPEARARLSAFLDRLNALESWLPGGSLGPERPYVPAAFEVLVRPYAPPDPELEQEALVWPLASPLAALGGPWPFAPDARCVVVSGEDLARLLPDVERANTLTPWRSGGEAFALLFRPLLPDERGC